MIFTRKFTTIKQFPTQGALRFADPALTALRFAAILAALVFFAAAFPARQGLCAAKQTPGELIRDFYAWYFEADKKANPVDNEEIFKYLAPETVDSLRKAGVYGEEYYFTKAHSWSAAWNDVKVIVGEAVGMADGISAVPVTFRVEYADFTVVVFTREKDGALRITKVVDTYPY